MAGHWEVHGEATCGPYTFRSRSRPFNLPCHFTRGCVSEGVSEGGSEPRPRLMAGAQRAKPSESVTPLEANGAISQTVRPSEETPLSRWPAVNGA